MAASWAGRVASLACVAGLILTTFALGTGKVAVVRVAGGSMAPALWPGDVCLVTEAERPAVSDIVLLAEPGHASRVLHRVRAVRGRALITKGDANPVADREPVPRSAVIGRVAKVLPVGRLMHTWQVSSGR